MYFDIEDLLTSDNAEAILSSCNDYLKQHHTTTQSLITDSNVNLICTTDNPTDDLNYHDAIKAKDGFNTTVLPAFRYDVFKVGDPAFTDLLQKLENPRIQLRHLPLFSVI